MLPEPPALAVTSLVLRRSRGFAVRIPSLQLPPGRTLCLTGMNGSGKTSLIEAVVGMAPPDRGAIEICGLAQDGRLPAPKRLLGFIPDDDAWIIPELSAGEYFALLASLAPKGERPELAREAERLASALSFASGRQQMGSLSHGNRKKVQIIAALMHRPRLVVVDELRNGLDPLSIRAAEELLKGAVREGAAVLAASHDLWWAERFADETLILSKGEALMQEKTSAIVEAWGSLENLFVEACAQEAHA